MSIPSILVLRYSKSAKYGSCDLLTFHGLNHSFCLSITLSMVRTGRGMCDVKRFHKLLEPVTGQLWSIMTNNDVLDSIFGNHAFHTSYHTLRAQ